MPTISTFYGIAIRIYVKNHPPPHFHAYYGDEAAFVSIETGQVIEGSLPPNAARLVAQWSALHRDERLENWRRIGLDEAPLRIEALDARKN